MSGRFLGAAPSRADDAATKGYVDAQVRQLAHIPPVGWLAVDGSMLSSTTGVALTAGRGNFHRLYLGPATYDALYVHCTTAQVGGTVSLLAGIYPDDGTGSWPDTSAAAPLASVGSTSPFTLTATGMRPGIFTTPWTLTSWAVVWVCSLYLVTTAPTTAPVISAYSNNIQNLARPTSINQATPVRGYYSTGLAALPVSAARTTGNIQVSGAVDITACAIRRSA